MGRSLADLFVTVFPDMDKFEPEFKKKIKQVDRQAQKQGQQTGEKFGKGMGASLKGSVGVAIGGLAASVAGIGLATVFTGFVNDARESARITRQTAAVIKSTGGAARVTAAQIGDLAEAISEKTGADDEAIQSGANLLLTFTNIRNGTGKTNKIFDMATAAITDMTAALNNGEVTSEGLKTSSIQLGKALNDPIKGVTALRKVGVSFTEQQTEQIKTLVDSGKTMEAQKIILAELAKEFGGSAEAAADPLSRLKVIAGNLGEDIGGALLPAVNRLATFTSSKLIPAFRAGAQAFRDGEVTSKGLVGAFQRVGVVLRIAWTGVHALGQAFKGEGVTSDGFVGAMERIGVVLRSVVRIIGQFVHWFREELMPVLAQSAREILPVLRESLERVRAAFSGNGEGGRQLVQVLKVLGVVLTQAVIPVLTFLVKVLLREWTRMLEAVGFGIRKIVIPAISALGKIFLDVAGFMLKAAEKAFGWIPGLGPKLKSASKTFDRFRDDVNRAIGGVKDKSVTVGAKVVFPKDWQQYRAGERAATGGPVRGPGGPTSDMVGPYWLSNGEHIWTAREVAAAGGHEAMVAARQEALRSGRGYAAGGGINIRGAFPSGASLSRVTDRISGAVESFAIRFGNFLQKKLSEMGAALPNGAGWRAQMNYLHTRFPGLPLISGFRPFAITATGNQSYHALGRAVDIPPRSDVFEFLRSTVGRKTIELIFSPKGNRQIYHGRDHYYGEPTRGDHFDHIHWALARGGVIREPILGMGLRSGDTYSFGERGYETVTPGVGGQMVFVNRGVVTTGDVENWFVKVQDRVRGKGRG